MQNLVINYDSFQLSDGSIQLLYDQINNRYEMIVSKNDQKINMVLDAKSLASLSSFVTNFVSTNVSYISKPIVGWSKSGAVYED